MKKLVSLILLFLLFFVCTAKAEKFFIENYNVTLQVSREQKVLVTEDIDVFFTHKSHGIIRDIPIDNSHVSAVDVSEHFVLKHSVGLISLKIGNKDKTFRGRHHYKIKFQHQLNGKDNEFYYNIIGTDWDVPIDKVGFMVVLPDNINPDDVGISIGKFGKRGFDGNAVFETTKNYVSGYTTNSLQPHEGVTIHIKMPSGYFVPHKNEWKNRVWLGLLLCTLLSFLIWHLFGRDKHVTPVISFYPPPNINPADAEQIYNEKVSKKGLAALIVYLADLGHIKISSDKSDFMLKKISDYEGDNEFLSAAMNILFRGKYDKAVCGEHLKNSEDFYRGWTALETNINRDQYKARFFEKSSMNFFLWILMGFLMCANVALTVFTLFEYDFSFEFLAPYISFEMIFIAAILFPTRGRNLQTIISIIFFILIFGVQIYNLISRMIDLINPEIVPQLIIGGICSLISFVCFKEMLKLNWHGRQILGHLLGLKKFIEVAEKSRLEKMVEDDPEYFYTILPYAYILGVSDKWIKQFENISVPKPEWGDGDFRFDNFNYLMKNFSVATVPSVENGGIKRSSSSGGGGFSGGGFGGGGGHSW